MKRQVFILSMVISLFSTLSAETVLKYSDGFSLSKFTLNSLPLRSKKHPAILSRVTIKAPSDGYIVVESSGKGCIHTNGKFMDLMLKRGFKTVSHNSFGWIGHGGACGMDEVRSYSFRHVERVKAGLSYIYKLVGQQGRTKEAISGNIYIGDLVAIFYSKERKKHSSNSKRKKILLADGSVKIKNDNGKDFTYNPRKFYYGTILQTPQATEESNRTEMIIKSNVQKVFMPEDPSTDLVRSWLDVHSQSLLDIIYSEVNNEEMMQKYQAMGEDYSIFEKIDRRSETIRHLFIEE